MGGDTKSKTIRIGILCDMADAAPDPSVIVEWLQLAVDEVVAAGRITAPVEFVHAYGHGLPTGSGEAVERAFAELVDQEVVLIAGPAIGDNALIATPLVEAAGVPTINWAGAERARGAWMFHLQVGSHEEESILLARHFHAQGHQRVGVIFDRSPIGERHLEFIEEEAAILGLPIVATAAIEPTAETAEDQVKAMLAADIDALFYQGLGLAALPVAKALTASEWDGPRAMNTAGIRGYYGEFGRAIDGWTYVDMHSDGNATLADLRQRYDIAPERALAAAKGYDLGRLVAEAIARAPEMTRAGLRTGLERTKWLPAAEGEEGTLLGFGIQDRGALHGRYLVLRQWRDGKTVEV